MVQAPAPVDVAPSEATGARPHTAPAAPEAAAPAAPSPPDDIDAAIAAAKEAGTWDPLRSWAASNGWSGGRVDALIARLERENADQNKQQESNNLSDSSGATTQRRSLVQAPPPDPAPEQELPATEQKHPGQQSTGSHRPAHAGSNVGNGNGAGNDGKKDQSRNSPDKRD